MLTREGKVIRRAIIGAKSPGALRDALAEAALLAAGGLISATDLSGLSADARSRREELAARRKKKEKPKGKGVNYHGKTRYPRSGHCAQRPQAPISRRRLRH